MQHMVNLELSFYETETPGTIRMVVMETEDGVKSVKDIFEGTPQQVLTEQLRLMELYDQFRIRRK